MYGFWGGTLIVLLYFAACVLIAGTIRLFTKIPNEVFRKLLHFVLLGSLVVWLWAYESWHHGLLFSVSFMLAVYPILKLAERIPAYSGFLTERKHGELKNSLLLVFTMFSVVILVGWGYFQDRGLCLASVLAWGIGDAAAALVGKRFGRHYLEGKHIEGRKSVEGTAAMFVVSFFSVLAVLLCRGGMGTFACVLTALVTAAVSAAVELFSLHGNDTIFCPLAAMAVLVPLLKLFGGL